LEYAAHKKHGWIFPLTAVLDEFQALGHLPTLRYGLNYFLGMGVTLCLITPSMHEIIDIWGEHHPFLEGTATKVIFGIRDERIAEKFTRPIGTYPETHTRTSTSHSGNPFFSRSTTTITTEERDQPLFSAQALRQLDDNKVLAIIGTQQVLLTKTPFYADKKLLTRSTMEIKS